MKKNLIGTALAITAMFSACQTLDQPAGVTEESPATTLFTAEINPETKTIMDYDADANVYKVNWTQNDGILILANTGDDTWEQGFGRLVEGAGTNKGVFASSLDANYESYRAFYGYYSFKDTQLLATFERYQSSCFYSDGTLAETYYRYYYPMYAESNGTDFQFKNLGSILKIGLTGTDYIVSVEVTANDPFTPLSGKAFVSMDESGNPVLEMSDDNDRSITYYLYTTLNPDTPSNCYIVLPPNTYLGGFTITVNSATGHMTKTISQTVVLERSQIRSIPAFEYVEEVTDSWSLIGSMTGWNDDIYMDIADGKYVIDSIYLTPEDQFKFRKNGSWEVNLGGAEVLSEGVYSLSYNGYNLTVSEAGYYQFVLDAGLGELTVSKLESYLECYSYEDVAAVQDETKVKMRGYVMATYGRGFILNIGNHRGNDVLVYQGTNQDMYLPVLGNEVEVYATKTTYRNLPELKNIECVNILDDTNVDYGYGYYADLTIPAKFESFNPDRYVYVTYVGTLEQNGNYWNVMVEGSTRNGSIEFPNVDISEYIGEKIMVEGYCIGVTSAWCATVLKKIRIVNSDGTTEDIYPGDDIVDFPSDSK
ncbi:MAG: hypothetical protein ACI4TM_05770 [Candidatus Cryptobacteroides sp.]